MGLRFILLLFAAFMLGVPIAFALIAVSIVIIFTMGLPLEVAATRLFAGIDSFPLVAIPLFILAGDLMGEGGMSRRLIDFANALVGHFSGGLALVVILGCMFFAAITGSAIAAAAAIGGLMIPVMATEGYPKRFSAPLTATAGSIGPILPPSIPLLVYGTSANVSIADLFIGGIIPGILMGISLMVVTYVIARRRNYRGFDQRVPFSEVLRTGKHALLALATPVIIIGGILSGQFTATESAAIAVFYAFVVGVVVYRELTLSALWRLTKKSALTTGTVLIVVAAASLFVYLLTLAQIPQAIGEAVGNLADSKWTLLLIINVILLIAGTFIDTVSAVVIFTPLFLPLVTTFGVDPVHFGVLLTVNLTIGMCTPPLGVNLFVVSGISGISILDMLRDLVPFVLALILVLFIVTYIPATVLWLPNIGG